MKRLLHLILAACLLALPVLLYAAYLERHAIAVTTNGSGDYTGYTPVVTGCILQVTYTPGAAPIDTGGDLDITGETSGVVIANHDNIGTSAFSKAYRQATHGVDGTATLYAAGGTAVQDRICVAAERIKLVIANGADTKSGTFYIYVGG